MPVGQGNTFPHPIPAIQGQLAAKPFTACQMVLRAGGTGLAPAAAERNLLMQVWRLKRTACIGTGLRGAHILNQDNSWEANPQSN